MIKSMISVRSIGMMEAVSVSMSIVSMAVSATIVSQGSVVGICLWLSISRPLAQMVVSTITVGVSISTISMVSKPMSISVSMETISISMAIVAQVSSISLWFSISRPLAQMMVSAISVGVSISTISMVSKGVSISTISMEAISISMAIAAQVVGISISISLASSSGEKA